MPATFRVRELIEAADLPQLELARLARLSPSTIGLMCSNRGGRISLATLSRVASVLGLTPGDLIAFTPDPPTDWDRRPGLPIYPGPLGGLTDMS